MVNNILAAINITCEGYSIPEDSDPNVDELGQNLENDGMIQIWMDKLVENEEEIKNYLLTEYNENNPEFSAEFCHMWIYK